ncbi:type 1 glutamine amidotransferase domain-containing protein [Brucella pseudogrignonensis]|uniref:type 1 glutamine amidotransferase domain-containing protein n=1 Tax=Brucella pseudogrignonensis TaxID=419475 RepID=UPI003ECEB446
MTEITDANIVILATDGYERSELRVPLEKLRERGATVKIASPKSGTIKSWDDGDWGDSVDVNLTLQEIALDDTHALVLPGGQINPDNLRADEDAIGVVRAFLKSGKIVAAICHAPWLLIEADAVRGRKVTSYGSIKTDLKNAGGHWVDEAVIADQGIITSRSPDDLDAFVDKIVEEIAEGRHPR